MSKCREAFLTAYTIREIPANPQHPYYSVWISWQAAWNARGKVDAEICKERGSHAAAEAIEQEQCE